MIAEGTAAADNFKVASAAGRTEILGLAAVVSVTNPEVADTLLASGLGGDDQFTSDAAVAQPLGVAFDGGDGTDTATVQGSDGNDTIQISAAAPAALVSSAGAPGFVQSVAENLDVNGLGGDDTINAGNGLATLTKLTIDGGDGNDTIGGGDGADLLIGGPGNDTVDGNRGNDVALLGDGNDVFVWDPGDGSDVVEGQAGSDTMRFNGANIAEKIDLSANGSRLRLFRDVANITMDTNGVETVQVNALGGADAITVNDLTGTDVTSVKTDLASRRRPARPADRQRHERCRGDPRDRSGRRHPRLRAPGSGDDHRRRACARHADDQRARRGRRRRRNAVSPRTRSSS